LQKFLVAVNTTDEAQACKLAAVALLVTHMQQADPEDLQSWFFRASKMFHVTGTTERARIQSKFEGTFTQPNPIQAKMVLATFQAKDKVAITSLAAQCYEMVEERLTATITPSELRRRPRLLETILTSLRGSLIRRP